MSIDLVVFMDKKISPPKIISHVSRKDLTYFLELKISQITINPIQAAVFCYYIG